jgi:stage V sporulation protein AF
VNLTKNLDENKRILKERLAIEQSFDIIGRDWNIGDINAYLVLIDGFAKDQIMLFILEELQNVKKENLSANTLQKLMQNHIAYIRR